MRNENVVVHGTIPCNYRYKAYHTIFSYTFDGPTRVSELLSFHDNIGNFIPRSERGIHKCDFNFRRLCRMIASCLIISILIGQGMSFSPSASLRKWDIPTSTKMHSAMERLHDPSTNAFGPLEHIYSLSEIDDITHKIEDDEWTALGSAIAESMLEMILDVGSGALKRMGWVERISITNNIAEEVSKTVTVGGFICLLIKSDVRISIKQL